MRSILLGLSMMLLSCTQQVASKCGGIRHTSLPITLYMSVHEPRMHVLAIEEAIESWRRQTGRPVFELHFTSESLFPIAKDGRNAVYFLNEWESNKNLEQGRTSLYWIGGISIEADIRINLKDFKYYVGDTPPLSPLPSAVNLESLFMHELGHAIGIFHLEKEKDSVMYPYLQDGYKRMTLSAKDLESFQCLYGK